MYYTFVFLPLFAVRSMLCNMYCALCILYTPIIAEMRRKKFIMRLPCDSRVHSPSFTNIHCTLDIGWMCKSSLLLRIIFTEQNRKTDGWKIEKRKCEQIRFTWVLPVSSFNLSRTTFYKGWISYFICVWKMKMYNVYKVQMMYIGYWTLCVYTQ